MIWIATFCLLAVAAWLIFNGINERRWVQAHSHDETVAADEGFLPSFSAAVAKRRVKGDGKVSIVDEDTRFARAVAKVQDKTSTMSAKLEARARAAHVDDADRATSAADEPDFFGRSVNRVRNATDAIGTRLDERMRRERMKGEEAAAGRSITEEGGLFPSAVAWVSEKTGQAGERIAERARQSARSGVRSTEGTGSTGSSADQDGSGRISLADEDSLFARAVKSVSARMEKVEGKLESQVTRSHDQDEDLLSRMSKKIGAQVNEIDERIVEKSRRVNDIEERIINSGSEAQKRLERK